MSAAEVVAHKSTGPRPVDDPSVAPRKGRSKVTNGKVLIAGVDQRSPWVRRAKDILASHISDLGGEANTSAAQRSLARRVAVLTTALEQLEARFAAAGEASIADLECYGRGLNTLRRAFQTLGLERRPRDVTTLDVEAEALGLAEQNERRRLHLLRMDQEIAASTSAGVTSHYDR
jgi:hypothetical protein